MGMNVGTGGSAEPDVMIDINTTPLIDVMLVLLVMLIITLPIQLHSVNLNMPVGNPPPPLVKPEVLKIDVDNAGRIWWNGEVLPVWRHRRVVDLHRRDIRGLVERKARTAPI